MRYIASRIDVTRAPRRIELAGQSATDLNDDR